MTAVPSTLGAKPPTAAAVARTRASGIGATMRGILRIAAIVTWSGFCFATWLVGRTLAAGSPRRRLRWRHWLLRRWSRGTARLFGMRITIRGTPPAVPFFLVSNHLSYLDIILFYGCLDCVFIAKHDMRRWPVLGFLTHVMENIWVNRESKRDAVRVLREIDRAVSIGDGVVLFPEGTTSAGDGMLPFRAALLDWAARREYPVHCAAVSYRTSPQEPPAHLSVCWWGDMPFGPHVLGLTRMAGFEAEVTFAPVAVQAAERGILAELARAEILRCFVPVFTPERSLS